MFKIKFIKVFMKKEKFLSNSKIGGIGYSALIFIYIILAFVLQGVIDSFIEKTSILNTLLKGLISPISIILTLAILLNYFNLGFKQTLGVKKFNPLVIITVLLVSIGMFFAFGFVNDLIVKGLNSIGVKPSGINIKVNSFISYLAYVLVLAVIPAIFEELFFRGFLLTSLKDCGGVFSLIISSLFFSLYHGSLAQLVYQFIYGIFLGAIFIQSKSIFPSIILHFINNFLIITLEYVGVVINFYSIFIISLGLILLAVSILLFIFVHKGVEETTKKALKGAKNINVIIYGAFGVLFCLLLIVGGLL
ncbi:MAG: CPBP family intramembrane metalloprotease [Clostridia bacterium]|nr:CPBP family intramembrane metalloprotease [Clostridia bacterium]